MILSALLFFLKIALAILGLLRFHINFNILCSISLKNAFAILMGIVSNQSIALGRTTIKTDFF